MVKSQPIMRYSRVLFAIVATLILTACNSMSGSFQQPTPSKKHLLHGKQDLSQASQNEFESLVRNLDVKSKIMTQYAAWKGVRYRLGGTTKRGIDCSAFVQRTFREQFSVNLPRSTHQQEDLGQHVKRSKLRPGDLVLFRAGSTGRHVGIYLGGGNFVHASTRSGVTISNLADNYWNARYREGRRVLSQG